MTMIFETKNYKDFLNQHLESVSPGTKGAKSALAQAVGCQTSYLSQVLHGEAHFNLEQAEKLAQYLDLTAQETEYLFLMVQFARAGTPTLRKHFQGKMNEILTQRMILKERLDVKEELTREDQSIYYSSWIYSAVHVLITIPQFRKIKEIAKKLHLSHEIAKTVLEFLVGVGLASEKNSEYFPTKKRIHLGFDASMIIRHHTNWRLNALNSLESKPETASDLHYSSVVSISKADALNIREKLMKEIQEAKEVIKESPEEELFAFHLDFYSL